MTLRGYSRQKVVDEYMQDYNPYEKHEPLQFAITLEIFALFSKQKE